VAAERHSETSATIVDPWDAHNRALVEHTHPPAWVNPAPAPRCS
jgi:hypothetical protein